MPLGYSLREGGSSHPPPGCHAGAVAGGDYYVVDEADFNERERLLEAGRNGSVCG